MADIVATAGKMDSDVEVTDVLNSIAPVRVSEDPPFRRYVGSPAKGLDLLFENRRVISVQIYVQKTRTFSSYSDDLPFELQGAKNQNDVHRVLGEPTESSSISSKYTMNKFGVNIVVTYDGSSNIRLISISPIAN